MKEEIMKMIQQINEYEEFDEDTDLFENDILDSLTLVMLIGQIEEKFDIFSLNPWSWCLFSSCSN